MATTECPACGDDFDSERGLKVHYRRLHGGTDYPWEEPPEYSCPGCDFGCDSQHGIYVHWARSHDGAPPWKSAPEGPECPDCDFVADSERALKIHYTNTHDGDEYPWDATSATVTTVCEHCGGEYEERRSRADRTRFCSPECMADWQSDSEKWRSIGYEALTDGEKEYSKANLLGTLNNLAEELDHPPTQRDVREQTDYSIDAFHTKFGTFSNALKAAGFTPDDRGGECPECTREFDTTRGLRGHLTKVHDIREGKATPCYGHGWKETRERRIQHDDRECQDCGISRSDHREQTGSDLQVHHKVPYRSFDDPDEANRLENLVTLCAACHTRRENHASDEATA